MNEWSSARQHIPDTKRDVPDVPWKRVDKYLQTNRESVRNRVSSDAQRLLGSNPVFGLRTLAAYAELTGWLPEDPRTVQAEQEVLPDFKRRLTDELLSKDGRVFLDALGILADLRSSRLAGNEKPNVKRQDIDTIGQVIVGLLREGTDSSRIKALRDTAILIRIGLFDDVKPRDRETIFSALRHLSGETIDGALTQLDARLQDPAIDEPGWPVPPRALYGLFTLADIKTIRTYAKRSDGDTTSAEHKTI